MNRDSRKRTNKCKRYDIPISIIPMFVTNKNIIVMGNKSSVKELNLKRLKIARLSNLKAIKGGDKETGKDDPVSYVSCKCSLTVIGSTQTLNQGPTRP